MILIFVNHIIPNPLRFCKKGIKRLKKILKPTKCIEILKSKKMVWLYCTMYIVHNKFNKTFRGVSGLFISIFLKLVHNTWPPWYRVTELAVKMELKTTKKHPLYKNLKKKEENLYKIGWKWNKLES